ncbi:hypothetical protein AT240_05730 [Bartonella henselae]|nr:hypothetical protein AT240_05730 [Bartonella henselae]
MKLLDIHQSFTKVFETLAKFKILRARLYFLTMIQAVVRVAKRSDSSLLGVIFFTSMNKVGLKKVGYRHVL